MTGTTTGKPAGVAQSLTVTRTPGADQWTGFSIGGARTTDGRVISTAKVVSTHQEPARPIQFSIDSPGMSRKSASLLVTRMEPLLIAWAAIIRSKSRPRAQPH